MQHVLTCISLITNDLIDSYITSGNLSQTCLALCVSLFLALLLLARTASTSAVIGGFLQHLLWLVDFDQWTRRDPMTWKSVAFCAKVQMLAVWREEEEEREERKNQAEFCRLKHLTVRTMGFMLMFDRAFRRRAERVKGRRGHFVQLCECVHMSQV